MPVFLERLLQPKPKGNDTWNWQWMIAIKHVTARNPNGSLGVFRFESCQAASRPDRHFRAGMS